MNFNTWSIIVPYCLEKVHFLVLSMRWIKCSSLGNLDCRIKSRLTVGKILADLLHLEDPSWCLYGFLGSLHYLHWYPNNLFLFVAFTDPVNPGSYLVHGECNQVDFWSWWFSQLHLAQGDKSILLRYNNRIKYAGTCIDNWRTKI